MQFHTRLKDARLKFDRSQQDMAKIFNITHATYNRWETGRSLPQPDRRAMLEKFIRKIEEGD